MNQMKYLKKKLLMKLTKLNFNFFILFYILFISKFGLAHEPLFMMSHDAPGRGAFDMHTSLEKNSLEDELELETEFGWGITRDIAIKFKIPVVFFSEKSKSDIKAGFSDPVLSFKWRFWDKDSLGQKFAIAWAFKGNIPIGSNNGVRLGNNKLIFESGLSHGMESIHYYYFIDARYHYNAGNNNKAADRLHLDISPGWRPFLAGLEDTDWVFFLESNYIHFFEGKIENDWSTQDIVFITPDILVSPSNRLMFRLGIQFPIWKRFNKIGPHGVNYKFSTEFRF